MKMEKTRVEASLVQSSASSATQLESVKRERDEIQKHKQVIIYSNKSANLANFTF